MDLHLHLSAAFRALDYKWGTPIDLDTSIDGNPCLPAIIERPNTTFSSEAFLKKVRRNRPKPYSRTEERRRKNNVKSNDSFSNISVSMMPSYRDEDQKSFNCTTCSSDTCDRVLGEMNHMIEDLKKPLEETFVVSPAFGGSSATLVSSQKKEEFGNVLKELKVATFSYIEKKLKRKVDKIV